MNIAWFHSHLLNVNSGGTRYVCDYLKYLQAKDYNITLYCDCIEFHLQKELSSRGIEIVVLDSSSTYSAVYWLTLPARLVVKYVKVRNSIDKYDLLVCSMFPMNLLAYWFKAKKVQVCFEPFAFFYDPVFLSKFSSAEQYFFKVMKALYASFDIHSVQAMDSLITISKTSQLKIRQIYNRPSEIVYAAVDTSAYLRLSKDKMKKFRLKYNGSPLLFHSTDGSGIKGTEYLIGQLKKVILRGFPNLKIIVVNYLADKKSLSLQQKKYRNLDFVHVSGPFPADMLPLVYASVDCVVQPNIGRAESWPLREALVCGTPIVGGISSEEADLAMSSLKIDITEETAFKSLSDFFKSMKRLNLQKETTYSIKTSGKKLENILINL